MTIDKAVVDALREEAADHAAHFGSPALEMTYGGATIHGVVLLGVPAGVRLRLVYDGRIRTSPALTPWDCRYLAAMLLAMADATEGKGGGT